MPDIVLQNWYKPSYACQSPGSDQESRSREMHEECRNPVVNFVLIKNENSSTKRRSSLWKKNLERFGEWKYMAIEEERYTPKRVMKASLQLDSLAHQGTYAVEL